MSYASRSWSWRWVAPRCARPTRSWGRLRARAPADGAGASGSGAPGAADLGATCSAAVVNQIVNQADGNALYLEELIRAASAGKLDALPETILAMLQARLQGVDSVARRILRSGSVFGEVFWYGGVQQLQTLPLSESELERHLQTLIEAELIIAHREPVDRRARVCLPSCADSRCRLRPADRRRPGERTPAGRALSQSGWASLIRWCSPNTFVWGTAGLCRHLLRAGRRPGLSATICKPPSIASSWARAAVRAKKRWAP